MSTVLNKSTGYSEAADKRMCPRCKGYGANITDNGDKCSLCKGWGVVWTSPASGWTRPLFGRREDCILY